MLSHFSPNTIDSHGTVHLGLALVSIHSAAENFVIAYVSDNKVFIFVIRIMSLRYLLKSIKRFLTVTVYCLYQYC